jgi:DNA-binding transcriptional LysR family regulator
VRTGACDVGFIWGGSVPDDLDAVPALVDPGAVVVPDGHRLADRDSVSIRDLHGERIVAPLATSTMRPVFDELFHRNGVEPHVVAEAATNEMVLELVRVGVGCTVTFASSAAPVVGRGALALEIADPRPDTFQLVTRSRQAPTPAARALVNLALERFTP